MRPGIPAAQLATLKAAEARVAPESAKGVKVILTALPSIGKTAFSWTYAAPLNGGQLVGVADNIKTTGYGAAMGRGLRLLGRRRRTCPPSSACCRWTWPPETARVPTVSSRQGSLGPAPGGYLE